METREIQTPLLRLQMGSFVAVLLLLGAMAALMVGRPSVAAVSPAPSFSPAVSISEPASRLHIGCEQCAVVTSVREIKPLEHELHSGAGSKTVRGSGKSLTSERVRRYEVTVLMRDGSVRVIKQARTVNWRVNERLTLIGSAQTSDES